MEELTSLIATDQIMVEISVRLGCARLTVGELSRMKAEDVLTLDREISDGVDICVGDKVVARGELTTSDDTEGRLCVRITGPATAS